MQRIETTKIAFSSIEKCVFYRGYYQGFVVVFDKNFTCGPCIFSAYVKVNCR